VVHAEVCYSVFLFTYLFILVNLQMYAIIIIITMTTAIAILGFCFTGQLLQKHAGLSRAFWRTIFHREYASVLAA